MKILTTFLLFLVLFSTFRGVKCQDIIIDKSMHHLRNSGEQEWAEFPLLAENKELLVKFDAAPNRTEYALQIRQHDVKQRWRVSINGQEIGNLVQDENDMVVYFKVGPGILKKGENNFTVVSQNEIADDIRVGEILLLQKPVSEVLSGGYLNIEVEDADSNMLLPSRITITRPDSVLQTVGIVDSLLLAVRPGFVYTGNGKASISLPEGSYTLYASRGNEYGIDTLHIALTPGERVQKKFQLSKEVKTEGWVNSDTHIHTVTYSGHGDATIEERAITIAGEGIQLPVLTDHNVHVDIAPVAKALKLDAYYTPVIGNEVTTNVGHFNIFPIASGAKVPDHHSDDWRVLSEAINNTSGVEAIILNHARDIHKEFRPFGPKEHIAAAGMRLDRKVFFANAMEVINSGSQQKEHMQLYTDWFGKLNRGYKVTPVGASDSHDVARYIVGQARTYIKGNGEVPGAINVDEVVENFNQGKVMVSFGLLTEILVNNEFGPGDIATAAAKNISVNIKVQGPSWIDANKVTLYANGIKIREAAIKMESKPGIKWEENWQIPNPGHDVFLVAIAEGPGVKIPFWPIAKPYQNTSPDFYPQFFGSTGAVFIDADGDGKFLSAYDYASELLKSGGINNMFKKLAAYDKAVAVQVASMLNQKGDYIASAESDKQSFVNKSEKKSQLSSGQKGSGIYSKEVVNALKKASPVVREGFADFAEAWKASQKALYSDQ